ncbi:MAG: hypothetical protein HSCHL_0894 [Hydrogenibacillus schlegelii]|uniref:Uncharacterized protein n=1 Tax=Hydrogenibacillus schlegelii TaxID=1484 RepID=A0A2T5GCZ5_HYDSH|nr:MAG: hypothetical protein HSCHL_0894 [Hydrogenibacillus schlegelii]
MHLLTALVCDRRPGSMQFERPEDKKAPLLGGRRGRRERF